MPITTTKTRQVADKNITYAKVQDISAANIILGRYTSGAGVAQELLVGAGLSISGSSLIANISGTTGYIPKFTGANSIGDSIISESGSLITVAGQFLASQSGVNVYLNPTYDTGYAGVQVASAHGLQFATSNATRVTITSAGNVGIGTTSPSVKLEVAAKGLFRTTDNGWGQAAVASPDDTEVGFVWAAGGTGYPGVSSTYTRQWIAGLSPFGTGTDRWSLTNKTLGANTAITVLEDGKVGIGTISPTYKLDVNGTFRSNALWTDNSSLAYWGGSLTAYGGLTWDTGYATVFATGGNKLHFGANGSSAKMTVDTTGNIGINTTTPGSQLSGTKGLSIVDATNAALGLSNGTDHWLNYLSGTTYRIWNNTSNEVMTITLAGNIGIGTVSPQKRLDVVVSANDFATVGATTSMGIGQWAGIHFGYREDNTLYRKSAIVFERTDLTSGNAQGKVHILNGPQAGSGSATLADARLTIAENGNVGIGVNPTNAKLEVVATTGEVFRADAAGGAYRIIANQSGVLLGGNVGIGTTNPSYKLDVDAGSSQIVARFTNSSNVSAVINFGDTGNSDYTDLVLYSDSGTGEIFKAGTGYASWGGALALNLYNSNGAIAFHPNGIANSMYISTAGNVGIGTTSPAYKLDVNGDINSGGTLYTNVFNFRSNDVKTNAATVGRFSTLTGGSSDFELTFTRSAIGAGAYYAIQSVEQNVGFRDLVLQLNGGSVGIGTTTPSTKLHINFAGQGLLVSNDSGNRRLYMGTDSSGEPSIQATLSNGTVRQLNLNSDGGNVLIGTVVDDGVNKLQVNGSAKVNGIGTFYSGAGSPVIIRKNASFTGAHYILFQNVGESQIAYMGYGSGSSDNFQVANSLGETQLYGGTSLFKLGYNGAESTINTTLRLTAGNTLSISQGDLYIQTGGYGILSPDANRLISIQNGAATINGALTVSGLLELNLANSGTNAYHTLNRNAITTENMFKWVTNGVSKWWLGQRSKNSEDGFSLYSGAVSDDVLYFNPAGNATFYKGVTAGGNILINAENTYMAIDATANPRLGFVKKSGFQPFLAFATDPFTIRVSSASNVEATNTFTTLFTIETSGAATFSSSVTATSFVKTGGTSAQFLKADGSVDSSTYLTTSAAATGYIQNQSASAQTASMWITGDIKTNGKVYIGTNGAYIEEVAIDGVYELRVVDSAGNTTVIS